MKFEYFNPNPNARVFKSGKPKSWNMKDSVVRAICKVTDKMWIDIYRELDELAQENYSMLDEKNIPNELLCNKYQLSYVTLGKPTTGQKRPTVKEFAESHNTGTFILYLRDYYVAVIDGVVYNTDESIADASIYSYWTK